jgi:hypothetical protein
MKTIASILLATGVGFAAAYLWVSKQSNARLQRELASREAAWQAEKQSLENALAEARSRAGLPQPIAAGATKDVTISHPTSPQTILDALTKLDPIESDYRNQTLRQVVYYLELLGHHGSAALPVIRDFLAQNIDVDYASPEAAARESGERSRSRFVASRASARTDYLVPPSLRLGLLDVLERIGGPDAEQILANTLRTTGRGVEVAYLARILQELAPDRYRELAVGAAKELLLRPPDIENPNRLDDNARNYLYQVLAMFDDTSFADVAQGVLVTPEGRIDRQALNYLNSSLKEAAVPALYAAYKDPRLTNQWEKANILNQALNYAGANKQANELLTEVVLNDAVPVNMRAYTVQSLAGAWRSEVPKDPQAIKSRMELLQSLKPRISDPALVRAIDATTQNLQRILDGEPVRNFWNPTTGGAASGATPPPPPPGTPQ